MKFPAMTLVLLALAGLGLSLFAGLAYHFDGHGLHPALAVLCGAFCTFAGLWAAGKVGSE